MNAATKTVLGVAGALLMASAPVGAADQTVPGTQLTLRVSNNGREKLGFRSTGSFTIPTPGSADDPRQNGASLQVFNPNTGETFTFSLPKTHWSLSPSGTQYRYKDSALAESGKVKTARIGTRSLRATGRKIGITLNESSQGVLAVVVASGTFRYCARFDDGSIRRDQPSSFNARKAPAPGSCPATGTTTTTILPLTTTTLTLPATTTTLTIPATTTTLTIPATTTTLTLPITTTTLTSPITTTTITSPITTTTVTTPITTTSTSTLVTVTTSTTTTSTTTTTTSASSTTTTQPLSLKFTNDAGTTSCGGAGLSPAPASPLTGELDSDTACSTKTNDLGRGCLYIGGGNGKAIPPGAVPSGATSYFDINGANLIASDGTGTLDCTKAAGPGKVCLNNDALPACTSDANCGGYTMGCHEAANCYFGPPLEFPNPILTSLSTCAINVVQTDGSGTGNPSTGDSSVTLPLSSWVYVTGNVTHPCPHCVGTACEYGSGGLVAGSCTTTASSETSQDCPPTRGGGAFQAPLSVTLSPLTTGTTSLTSASGNFCPSQKTAGAFGVSGVQCVQTVGMAAGDLTDGAPHSGAILASAFCIPTTSNSTIDGVADLPGPGLTSLPGTAQIVPTP